LSGPSDVVVDDLNDELLVSNNRVNSVTVYARTATGSTAPLRILSGPATLLHAPFGLAVDVVNNELMATNFLGNSVTVYPRTASGSTAPIRVLSGVLPGLNFPLGLAVDAVHDELMVTNVGNNSVTVYPRTASGGIAPIRTLQGNSTGLVNPGFAAVTTTGSLLASVALDHVAFGTGQTITYQATLTPGVTPTQVDIYLGCLLPDGATFLSLVQPGPGTISITLGPSPVPFLSNVPLVPTIVQFSYQFAGFEPPGTYVTYAGLAVAGSNPFLPANQLSLAVQPFQFTP
jgi:DNA-binding beta-propeller fold protein YncE